MSSFSYIENSPFWSSKICPLPNSSRSPYLPSFLPSPPLRLALGILKLYPEINIKPPAPFSVYTLDDLPLIFVAKIEGRSFS